MEANRDNKQEIFLTNDFLGFQLLPFEDQQFYVASGYDHILTVIFGDYMKIPPKEKQVSHIIHKWGFYWK
jgi:lipopolysaccharide cholinephosphotransferase